MQCDVPHDFNAVSIVTAALPAVVSCGCVVMAKS